MCGLHRTASVADNVQQTGIEETANSAFQCLDIDCGICRIGFQRDITALQEISHLRIRFNDNMLKASRTKVTSQIKATLNEVQNSGVDFATTFDFRDKPMPNMKLLGAAFADCCDKRAKTWARRSKSVAILISGNLLAMVAAGAIAKFIEVCGLSVCPIVICHQDAVASEFFKNVALGDLAAPCISSFVSVTGLRDVGTSCYSYLCPWNPWGQSSSGIGRGSAGKDARGAVKAPRISMHTLDNGDVRVIQSPPSDLMPSMKQEPTKPRMVGTATGGREAHAPLHQLIEGVVFRCTARTIHNLIGINFHLGELVIDADFESCLQRGENIGSGREIQEKSSGQQRSCNRKVSGACELRDRGCLTGVWLKLAYICS